MPPSQARTVDTWVDYYRCWSDVYENDNEEMQACEASPGPVSGLELWGEYAAQIMASQHSAFAQPPVRSAAVLGHCRRHERVRKIDRRDRTKKFTLLRMFLY